MADEHGRGEAGEGVNVLPCVLNHAQLVGVLRKEIGGLFWRNAVTLEKWPVADTVWNLSSASATS